MNSGGWVEQTATVVEADPARLWLRAERRQHCASCGVRRTCGSAALSRWQSERDSDPRRGLLCVDNTLDARPGDRVVIGVADAVLLRASAFAYLLPLLAAVAAALAATAAGLGDPAVAAASLGGLLCGLALGRQAGRRRARDFRPVLRRVLAP